MQRTAVFVDAGYIYAQSAVCLTGSNVNRAQLKLDESELIDQLKSLALTVGAGAQLLRIYWYDGAKNGMTVEQLVLADMPDVKVRLGSINSAGQQKGVDSLLVTDLIDLAVVVTGDGDMRIAVQIAQSFGVRVHLVGLEPIRVSQSALLRQEADTVHQVVRAEVERFMQHSPGVSVVFDLAASASLQTVSLEAAIKQAIRSILGVLPGHDLDELRKAIQGTRPELPQQYDRRILGTCRALLGRDLEDVERRQMRQQALLFVRFTDVTITK